MTQEQFDVRSERAKQELFVISPTDEGWRVRSAHNPSNHYLVMADGEAPRCSCPDFEKHIAEDPGWMCKHILAVRDYQRKTSDQAEPERYEKEQRAAIQGEAVAQPQNPDRKHPQGQMLVKRSLSPDGRIDSISLEFSFELAEESAANIKSRALKALKLQTEIVQSFLGSAKANGRENGSSHVRSNGTNEREANGAIAARMLDVGLAQTAYGERVFVNFDVNGRRARLFGSEKVVLDAVAAAGKHLGADAIEQGRMLNLPCRVITEQNGKYLNVAKVFAAARGNWR